MTRKILTSLGRFYAYQKERFPIGLLGLSLLPAVLSSGVIVSADPTRIQVALALTASLAYLLHIRVIDERRDFEHDNVHHTDRPVQVGAITQGELRYVDALAVSLLVVIAVTAGLSACIAATAMLVYSYIAGKEFFVGERVRRYFFVYNGANLIQMLLMQVFVYTVFSNPISVNFLLFLHFAFTTVGTVIFEFVRKLKIPGDDGTGKDTYTWYLGFNKAIVAYVLLVLLDATLFFKVAIRLSPNVTGLLIFSVSAAAAVSLAVLLHRIKKTHLSDKFMQVSFLITYAIFNLSIYFLGR